MIYAARGLGRPVQNLGDVVNEAILDLLSNRPARKKNERMREILVFDGEPGLQPGVDLNNSAELEDILDGYK